MTAAERFAEWALALRLDEVPPAVVEHARMHLLDGYGCALAAVRARAAEPAVAVARAFGSANEATIVGGGERVPAPAAALANGTLVHALDHDDTHAASLIHATSVVLPAALAVGEASGAWGSDVLASAIAGYEVVARLGAAITHGFHSKGLHATSVCGVFSSALIASTLMRSSHERTVNALGIAGSLASGSLEFLNTGSSTKQLHPGLASMNGILAARLAAAGAEGPSSVFEGEHGLFASFVGERVDAAALTGTLGDVWETPAVAYKLYPACQLSHASLDALRSLGPLDVAAIERITFSLPDECISIVCEPADAKRAPRTAYEGKFSLPFCAAALLVDGRLDETSFDAASLERTDLRALAARVSWESDPFAGAPADAPGSVVVRLRDGSAVKGHVAHSRGGPDVPATDDDVIGKFQRNGGTMAQAASILQLDTRRDVRGIL